MCFYFIFKEEISAGKSQADESLYSDLTDVLKTDNNSKIAAEIMNIPDLAKEVKNCIFEELKTEVRNLCAKSSNSILRKTDKYSLLGFSFKKIVDEWKEKAPLFYRFLVSASENPRSQVRNKVKKGEALQFAQVSAGSKLLNAFCRDMRAIQYINDIIFLKGGMKKSAFNRMQSTGDCHGYKAAISMADTLAENWDENLLQIQSKYKADMEIEAQILQQLSYINDTIDLCKNAACDTTQLHLEAASLEKDLHNHRKNMHPGYYFVGDNVDIVTKVRHMTANRQHKDQHMFQMCAYINRVSGNDLDNTTPLQNAETAPFAQIIPGPAEHETLMDNFAFLVAKKWCQYIPYFGPYKSILPQHITHPYMKDTQKRTERVCFLI